VKCVVSTVYIYSVTVTPQVKIVLTQKYPAYSKVTPHHPNPHHQTPWSTLSLQRVVGQTEIWPCPFCP